MTPHDTYQEQLLDLAYGELGKREARALRAHLESCPGCRAELERMAATRSAMSALPEEPAPGRGEAILLAAARETARERRPKPLLPSWVWSVSVGAVGVAAVALLVVRLAGTVGSRLAQPQGGELVSRTAPAEEAKAAAPTVEAAREPGREGMVAKAAPARTDKDADDAGVAQVAGNATSKPPKQAAPPPELATKRKAPAGAARDDLALGKAERAEERSGAGLDAYSASGTAGPPAGAGAAAPDERAAQPRVARSAAPSAPPAPPPAPGAEFARPPPGAARLEEERGAVASAEKKDRAGPRNRTAGAKKQAAPVATEDAIARYEQLRAAGRLHTATVSFRDCPGETSRRVEQDDEERVVKVTRRGTLRGTAFEAEQFYGEDGLLGAVRYRAAGVVQELRLGAAGAASAEGGVPASVLEPLHASEAGLDAPPRCEE